jgi:DNA-binding XRE family transcriptional regulator
MSIGKNIQILRTRSELSQLEMATALGISDKTVSSWEVDRTEPKLEMIGKICAVLECSILEIIETGFDIKGSDRASDLSGLKVGDDSMVPEIKVGDYFIAEDQDYGGFGDIIVTVSNDSQMNSMRLMKYGEGIHGCRQG